MSRSRRIIEERPKLKAAAANLLSPAPIPFIGVGFSGREGEPRHRPSRHIAFSLAIEPARPDGSFSLSEWKRRGGLLFDHSSQRGRDPGPTGRAAAGRLRRVINGKFHGSAGVGQRRRALIYL